MLGFGRIPDPAHGSQETLDFVPQASNSGKFLLRSKADESYFIWMEPVLKARGDQPKTLNFNKIPDVTPMYLSEYNGSFIQQFCINAKSYTRLLP